jgi:uncharacterized protein (DUF983 family)
MRLKPRARLRASAVWRLCFKRVLHRRCPQCGRGALFRRYATLCERCFTCGLIYRREPGAELGSMYLSTMISPLFAALVFTLIWIFTDWNLALSLFVSLPLVVGFSYGFLPYAMGLWTALEYLTDVANGEWWAQPRR